MATNISTRCLNDAQLQLARSPLERALNAYFLPFILIFGSVGNLINLTVLLTPKMRTK